MEKHSEIHLADAFKTVINLQIFEGELVWSRYATMLTTHTILLTLLGLLFNNGEDNLIANFPILKIIIPSFGIGLTYLWFLMTARGYSWYEYWVLCAREIEDKISSENLNILRRGEIFKKSKEVNFDIWNEKKKRFETAYHIRPWFSRGIATHYAAYTVVAVFFLLYCFFLYIGIFK